jgi:uncharacterized protein (TIGR02646 family)
MIKVDVPRPSTGVLKLLRDRKRRGTRWSSRNPQRVRADEEINRTLQVAFSGKCGYCECNEAETIDHFWPQSLYHDHIWDWDNFILACTPCQNRKASHSPLDPTGYQMVNPRQDEPLQYLRFNPDDGKIFAIPTGDATEQRGAHTITLLELDQRPDLDRERRKLYKLAQYLILRIIQNSPAEERADAWQHLQELLDVHSPYLAIIQQLFTFPPEVMVPLIQRLYELEPQAHDFLARFRRPVRLVPNPESDASRMYNSP